MSRLRWLDLPFSYTTQQDFAAKLAHWLSQVFYDRLPAAGFEVREEQIYTAYHMAQALCQRQTLFAEAGSGTKTSPTCSALLLRPHARQTCNSLQRQCPFTATASGPRRRHSYAKPHIGIEHRCATSQEPQPSPLFFES